MKPFKQLKQDITESSLSRIWKHNEEHDCGAMTAVRINRNCGEGERYTNKENKQRNRSLLSKLKTRGYGVTKLHGRYPEGMSGLVGKEISYFVVDLNDSGTLERDLRNLGEEFEQDSVLSVPRGAVQGDSKAYLIGTNHCKNNWITYGKKEVFKRGRMGYDSPIYTSYVNGRPFVFEEVGDEILDPSSGMGVWAMHLIAEKDWQDIDV
jgi:hypothetical protein